MLLVAAVPAWTKAEVVPGPWQQYVLFIGFALRFNQLLVALLTIFFIFYFSKGFLNL